MDGWMDGWMDGLLYRYRVKGVKTAVSKHRPYRRTTAYKTQRWMFQIPVFVHVGHSRNSSNVQFRPCSFCKVPETLNTSTKSISIMNERNTFKTKVLQGNRVMTGISGATSSTPFVAAPGRSANQSYVRRPDRPKKQPSGLGLLNEPCWAQAS